jgi:hypothetical protein
MEHDRRNEKMWMARRQEEDRVQETAAELGEVTLSGAPAGVVLAGEKRDVAVLAPGGYTWSPALGETVLVLRTGQEGAPCAVGQVQGESGLEPGEVLLSVADGAGIRLRPDGTIAITGKVTINGEEV